MTSLEFRDRLARRTRRAKAPISLTMLEPLEAYFRLLSHWNAKINLTALPLDSPTDETFDRLLVEPLVASKQIPTHTPTILFDLGSGGGSPAIPLKIARPALHLTMIESKERKGAFLREAIRALSLADTTVETARFEETANNPSYQGRADFVTVRAVRPDEHLFASVRGLLRDGGRLLLFRPPHSATPDPPGLILMNTVPLVEAPKSFLSVYKRVFHVEHS